MKTRILAGFANAALITVAIAGAISGAHAATVVVDSVSTFDADTSGQTTSNFDSFGITGSNFAGFSSVMAGTATFTGTAGGVSELINVNGPGFAASGGNDFLTNSVPDNVAVFAHVYTLTITLSSSVTAFGLDFGTSTSGQNVSFALSNGATANVTTPESFFDGLDFIGFISSQPFDTITLSVTGPSGWGVEDITTATAATPLPAAIPLFASGLGALGLFGWRRKRTARSVAA
jgi:hypothetical protein